MSARRFGIVGRHLEVDLNASEICSRTCIVPARLRMHQKVCVWSGILGFLAS